jgi:hypothetical protein
MKTAPAPWRRHWIDPRTVLAADGNIVLSAALWPGQHDDNNAVYASHMRACVHAQQATALPDLIAAAQSMVLALDAHYPSWSEEDLSEAVSPEGAAALLALRLALRRADGLLPDGSIPGPGVLP